jgi:hypothetical protein
MRAASGNGMTWRTVSDNLHWKDAWRAVDAGYRVTDAQMKAMAGTQKERPRGGAPTDAVGHLSSLPQRQR